MYFIGHFVLCLYTVSVSIELTAAIWNKPFIHSTHSNEESTADSSTLCTLQYVGRV